jgi:hypothetical protein
MNRAAEFARLRDELPHFGDGNEPDLQIRAVLGPLLLRICARLEGEKAAPIPADPRSCPNCGRPTNSLKSPYGSEFCKSQAAFIRQFRGSMETGALFEPERQIALGQALWSLQGGGFPRRQSMVPARVIAKVIEREGGVCQLCGAPATEIDHTGSG